MKRNFLLKKMGDEAPKKGRKKRNAAVPPQTTDEATEGNTDEETTDETTEGNTDEETTDETTEGNTDETT